MKHRTPFLLGVLILVITACTAGKTSELSPNTVPIYFLAPTEQVRGSDALCQSLEDLDLPDNAPATETAVAWHILPTKVSELTNDAGYLTSHQDISGKINGDGNVLNLAVVSAVPSSPDAKTLYIII